MAKISDILDQAKKLASNLENTEHYAAAVQIVSAFEELNQNKRITGRKASYTDEDVERIKAAHAAGMSIRSLAVNENKAVNTIQKILRS